MTNSRTLAISTLSIDPVITSSHILSVSRPKVTGAVVVVAAVLVAAVVEGTDSAVESALSVAGLDPLLEVLEVPLCPGAGALGGCVTAV